jgi:DEAD/DEAH box helicase domain-containing protein
MHQYRGVFGSNVANVIRRLRRICDFYGSRPTFILCSATIGNPGELAERLISDDVTLIDRNGAPAPEKTVAVYNPPVVNPELGIRQSMLKATRNLMGRLVHEGVQTIAFVPSRQMVELLLTYVSEEARGRPGEVERIAGYRSGYLPLERRRIEAGLRSGEIRGVVSTSALEVGIDIGGLGASIAAGYPGTLAGLWQRFGRAGRKDEPSFAVLVTGSNPLDQYIAANPDFLFDGALENALVDPENVYVLASHLKCAAFELPFATGDTFGRYGAEMLDILVEEGVLQESGGRYFWMSESYPAEQVSLRQVASDNFIIIETGPKPRVIGNVDRPSAPLLIHEEAIYLHLGRQYQVEYLDWDDKKAYVHPVDVDYYTDASLAVDLKVLEAFDERALGAVPDANLHLPEAEPLRITNTGQPNIQRPLTHLPAIATQPARFDRDLPAGHPSAQPAPLLARGEVAVTYLATIFKKVRLHTHENIGWGRISIPQEDMHTQACWLALAEDYTPDFSSQELDAALSGIASLVGSLAPLRLMCDPLDIHAVPQVRSPATGLPTVFVYDNLPGGVGLSERLYEILEEVLAAARELAARCLCEAGCPSCVGPPASAEVDGKRQTLSLLDQLTGAVERAACPV